MWIFNGCDLTALRRNQHVLVVKNMDTESDSVDSIVLDWSSEDGEVEQPAVMEADMESDGEFEQPPNSAFLRRRIHCKR